MSDIRPTASNKYHGHADNNMRRGSIVDEKIGTILLVILLLVVVIIMIATQGPKLMALVKGVF